MSLLQVRAPGKAMLIGEYAVLDGGPAVVAAVDCCAIATLSTAVAGPASEFIAQATARGQAAVAQAGRALPAGTPVVDTSAFSRQGRKLGVGSSAAATVAAVGVLFAAAGLDPAQFRPQIRQAATEAHDAAQGVRGSGADVLAASFGGLQALHADLPPGPLPAELRFVATSRSISTARLLSRLREVEPAARSAVQEMAAAAEGFLMAWRSGSCADLLSAVERSFAAYVALGRVMAIELITEEHAALQEAARKVGGTAKPSGAGGGNLAVLFLPDAAAADALWAQLPDGLQPLPFQVSASGVHAVWRS